MPRGGKRTGTPGKGYTNRTDLGMRYTPQEDAGMATPAAGGVTPPRSQPPMPPVYADDIPNLMDPTSRPGEPITDGLRLGPGRGPDALQNRDPRNMETSRLKKWLPLLDPFVDDPETPDSVRAFIRYVRAS
jgi:hypothetical protein